MIQIIAAGGAFDMNYNQHFVTRAVKDSHVRDSLLSAPLCLFLQLPRITHSGTLGVDMPVIDLYFCICICAISLLRRGHVND